MSFEKPIEKRNICVTLWKRYKIAPALSNHIHGTKALQTVGLLVLAGLLEYDTKKWSFVLFVKKYTIDEKSMSAYIPE